MSKQELKIQILKVVIGAVALGMMIFAIHLLSEIRMEILMCIQ